MIQHTNMINDDDIDINIMYLDGGQLETDELYLPGLPVSDPFTVIGYHYSNPELYVARSCEYGVDYRVSGRGASKRVYPLKIDPVIVIETSGKSSFFNGNTWKDITLIDVDVSDGIKARLLLSGQFFPSRTSRGNITWPVSTIFYDVYHNPDFYTNNNIRATRPVKTVEIPVIA